MNMVKNRDYRYLRCSSRYFNQIACLGGFIPQRFLETAVLEELNTIIEKYFDEEEAENSLLMHRREEQEKKKLVKEKTDVERRKTDLENAIKNTYLDKVKGLITDQEFMTFRQSFEQDVAFCQRRLDEIRDRLEILEQEKMEEQSLKMILGEYRSIKQLDRTVVDSLIDYIEVGRNDHKMHKTDLPPIIIHWKF